MAGKSGQLPRSARVVSAGKTDFFGGGAKSPASFRRPAECPPPALLAVSLLPTRPGPESARPASCGDCLHPVDKRFRSRALHIRRIERFRAENNGGHAVEDSVHAALQGLLMRGFTAGYRAADKFRASVASASLCVRQRSAGVPSGDALHHRRVGRGTPRASINDPAGTGTPYAAATRVLLPKAMALVA